MLGSRRTAVLAAVAALALSGCGSGDTAEVSASEAWPGRHADARNSNTTLTPGTADVTFSWTRSASGMVGAPPTVARNGQIYVTSASEAGCNLFSFETSSGRKRWCTRLAPGVSGVSATTDDAANIYVGEDGGLFSFNEHGQRRWRIPVSGTPQSAQFAGDGSLVVVTHFGQVNIVDPQTGRLRAPLFDLVPIPSVADGRNIPRLPSDHGLAGCFGGSPDCPVATTPAVDAGTGRIFTTLRRPDSSGAALVAVQYADGAVTSLWSQDGLPGGALTDPVLSADGTTVYVHDGDGVLWALDAASGEMRRSHDFGFVPSTAPAVSPDGVIVPASGGEAGPLVAVRDTGDGFESVWERTDVRQVGVPALTSNDIGYAVVEGSDGPRALVFDTTDGTTLDEEGLDNAAGFSPGTAVGPDGEFVTVTVTGDVFVLAGDE